ncbi:MAG: hypothetical protein PHG35_05330 [Dehalococcoidales bacterium]|nr:hypothetical protein [Dehalococcoidales bacterium]
MAWNAITVYLQSWFNYNGVGGTMILLSLVLAIVFGAVWLIGHRPPLLRKPGLWLTLIASALITVLLTAFIYKVVEFYYVQWLGNTFSGATLNDTVLLWSILLVVVIALVQEGAKLIPMLFWRAGSNKPDVKTWVAIGAIAGAGFGIFEAFNSLAIIFGSGWTWGAVSAAGFTGLLPVWLCFWTVAYHIGITAIIGYGMAKGSGGGYYMLAVLLHAAFAYLNVLVVNGNMSSDLLGVILAIGAAIIIAISYWLSNRKYSDEPRMATAAQPYPQQQYQQQYPQQQYPQQQYPPQEQYPPQQPSTPPTPPVAPGHKPPPPPAPPRPSGPPPPPSA